jgi:hypothetical protein
MIIKLPICIDDKISFINFQIEKINNILTVKVFDRKYENNIKKMKVPLCNNFDGITYIDLFFPLEMKIVNNKLLFNNFFEKVYLSENNLSIDFFLVLEKELSKMGLSFIKKEELNKSENILWDYWNNYDDNIVINQLSESFPIETIKKLWEVMQLYINFSMYLIYLKSDFTNKTIKDYLKTHKLTKKISNLANIYKSIKFSIYSSNEYSFNEHYPRINNTKAKLVDLKVGFKYFIKSIETNKFFQIEINNINDTIIHTENNQAFIYSNYEWYFYISNLDFTYDLIIFNLLRNEKIYQEFFERCNLKIEQFHCKKLLEYYTMNNYECSLIYFNKYYDNIFSDFELLKRNNYSNMFFQYISEKYKTKEDVIKILNILFENYTYPIKQNKLDRNFDHILYYSFNHIEILFNTLKSEENTFNKYNLDNKILELVPSKLKTLYYNITNLFYQIFIKNNYQFLTSNQKFYNDYLHRVIIRILFSNPNLLSSKYIISTFNSVQIDRVINIFKKSILCIDVVNRLSWSNLPKRLNYLNILYENKDIIFFTDKLNKNIFPDNYDLRLKKIIEQPFEMFKYLRKEKDFIKWLKFCSNILNNLFYSPISLSSEDIIHLGKIIFLLINIKEQNLKAESYLKFINYCQKYNKLILDNTRINLKIKENFTFLKISLNLGFLAKHLTYNKEGSINFEDDFEKTQDLIKIEELLRKVTKKYYKYKIKYNQSKKSNATEYPLSATSVLK